MKVSTSSKFIKGSNYQIEVEKVLNQVEEVLKTRHPICSSFISAPSREELINIFNNIADINYLSSGGYPNAERQRILLQRESYEGNIKDEVLPLSAIQIEGNFLFDRAKVIDFRKAITQKGIALEETGDIFLSGDRGAQAICTPKACESLNNKDGAIRSVKIQFKLIDMDALRIPPTRNPRKLLTIEASRRLDAITSAGFGLSRAKVLAKIKEGVLRLNWQPVNRASHCLVIGDKIQLEGKGSIEVINLEITKRARWRVELLRK